MQSMPQDGAFKLRKGQQDVATFLSKRPHETQLGVSLPTGYGKSVAFALCWKHCCDKKIANRLLIIVANDAQRVQFANDFAADCALVDAPCDGGVWIFNRTAGDIREAKHGHVLVYVCTVQQLAVNVSKDGVNVLFDMLSLPGTTWMIGFDEFHHYGEDMVWGNAAKLVIEKAAFVAAMSATPYRRGSDTIFGKPQVVTTYVEAVSHKAVKPMVCHSYEYSVDVMEDGKPMQTYTTTELLEMSGGDIDRWEERRNIRYNPQYIHPLLMYPMQRLRECRAQTGKRLQMLVRAMSCTHAQMVREQIMLFADGLDVEWVGTGSNGRSDDENKRILKMFCPPKNRDGSRPEPKLDILIQVRMAGEGFDSVNVIEVVDLFPVSDNAISGKATTDKQFYGRAARVIPGHANLHACINVPSDHPLHSFAGKTLHEWMDSSGGEPVDPNQCGEFEPPQQSIFDFTPFKQRDVQLISVIQNEKHFAEFAENVAAAGRMPTGRIIDISDPECMEWLKTLYLTTANHTARSQAKQVDTFRAKEELNKLISQYTRCMVVCENQKFTTQILGQYKREINTRLKRMFGMSRDDGDLDMFNKQINYVQGVIKELEIRHARKTA